MKITARVLWVALFLVVLILTELFVGVRWSLAAYSLPDFELKPIRPVARFAFTGVVVTFTIVFSGAFVRAVASYDYE